jgi:fumarate reductase flavoprotein subunit
VVRPLFIGSIPGLEVDDTCHVVTSDGNPVENLYACGELIFGNVFQTAYPASGTGVGTSTYTGAIAGEAAYKELAN